MSEEQPNGVRAIAVFIDDLIDKHKAEVNSLNERIKDLETTINERLRCPSDAKYVQLKVDYWTEGHSRLPQSFTQFTEIHPKKEPK